MTSKKKVIIFGAGKIGSSIANLLHHSKDYEVLVADKDTASLERLKKRVPVQTIELDATNEKSLTQAFKGWDAVVSAGPFFVNQTIATAALNAGISYFDLTEDRATTQAIRVLADGAKPGQIFMPQCGLAPGFIGILASEMCGEFDELNDVKMRVGALPQYPSNMLMYNLTWSTDGLINEYCNPCEAIHEGKLTEVLPLDGLEMFSLDGITYEAFNTSGGLGTLCETLEGKVRHLNYKTVRYQGHQYLMQFLVQDLRMSEDRGTLKRIMESAVPITLQDVVLVFCTIQGKRNGQLVQMSNARKIYSQEVHGELWSAIQVTTAAALCAVLDMHTHGKLPSQGFVRQEQVSLTEFLANRFGKYYESGHTASLARSARISPNVARRVETIAEQHMLVENDKEWD
ncbi:MAG TPA: saccharopine dehydrogenase NADP-binding domain-containing protein [Thermoflexales bacterium]|nr:saccharopine dehydrogenase NADP-binding domain-containing protein [Thermoflexales bacterium]HQW33850.1 saccharopine dehydrogenase NADP-binding domain-containing protein [Thermoflexales bacterium]HQZ21492.1 saccharopine dehydrogenase NADP-binding domain-containing protein [Thermoflexales bacterium]HRA00330.1 saccharopine dehydrogenase NADP-binding domain-containing protein [Thermoflexales bacterium]